MYLCNWVQDLFFLSYAQMTPPIIQYPFEEDPRFLEIDDCIDTYDESIIEDAPDKCHLGICLVRSEEIFVIAKMPSFVISQYASVLPDYLNSWNSQSRSMQLDLIRLDNGYGNPVIKTFWIRLIQRCWKRALRHKQDLIRVNKCPDRLWERQLYGHFRTPIPNRLLCGLLAGVRRVPL